MHNLDLETMIRGAEHELHLRGLERLRMQAEANLQPGNAMVAFLQSKMAGTRRALMFPRRQDERVERSTRLPSPRGVAGEWQGSLS